MTDPNYKIKEANKGRAMPLKRLWDRGLREEIRAFHRQIQGRHTNGGGWASVPGFAESLQRLFDEGYCAADVSVFLGLSRERVRQFVEEFDLEPPDYGSRYRVWNEERSRFVPVSTEDMAERVGLAHEYTHEHALALRCDEDIKLLREMHRDKDLVGLAEFCGERGVYPTTIAQRWGSRCGCSNKEAWDRLWQTAGFERQHRDGRDGDGWAGWQS